MKEILVVCESYPSVEHPASLRYIHSRNKIYSQHGIKPVVLNFCANSSYSFEGIEVVTEKDLARERIDSFPVVIFHSPNVRNHLRFWKMNNQVIHRAIIFAHGHEFLKTVQYYPRVFECEKKSPIILAARNGYDIVKLKVWKSWLIAKSDSVVFVSVSNWMRDEAFKCLGFSGSDVPFESTVIPNCVGEGFERCQYDWVSDKQYDCLTIRPSLDNSKYCIDIVYNLARSNPSLSFLVVGKGTYFHNRVIPPNISWWDRTLTHAEVISVANSSRCALMPTRLDAQGVMACELASFGMPLITSDIGICRDVFSSFDNVKFIDNNYPFSNLDKMIDVLTSSLPYENNETYYACNTIEKELHLINRFMD